MWRKNPPKSQSFLGALLHLIQVLYHHLDFVLVILKNDFNIQEICFSFKKVKKNIFEGVFSWDDQK